MAKDAQSGDRRPQPASAAKTKSDISDTATRAREKTARNKEKLLAAYCELGNVREACRLVGVHRDTHYAWLADDPEYARRFADCSERAVQTLEDEAIRRAVQGTEEPVIHAGQLCYRSEDLHYAPSAWSGKGRHRKLKPGAVLTPKPGARALHIRRYSDQLLMFLLKGHRPDKYKERLAGEFSGPHGKPMKSELKIRLVRPPAVSE